MRVPIEVRYADYDTKQHVNNAVFLTYFEMARTKAWVERLEGDADFPIIIAEAQVRYVKPADIGIPLACDITTGEIRNRSWTWHYRVVDARDDSLIAEGRTVQVYYDYEAAQAAPIPDALRARLPEL